jgi:hypothetical protein
VSLGFWAPGSGITWLSIPTAWFKVLDSNTSPTFAQARWTYNPLWVLSEPNLTLPDRDSGPFQFALHP